MPEPGVCRGHSVQSHFRHEPESREWFPVQAVITDRHIRSHPQARQSIRLRGNGSGLRWSGALLILLPRSDGRLRLRSLLPMMGMEVCGISCITNMAAGVSNAKLNHAEVQETADRVAKDFEKLVTDVIAAI